MSEKLALQGTYTMYKGKPLVREKNLICYGDMTDKCYLSMLILEIVNITWMDLK